MFIRCTGDARCTATAAPAAFGAGADLGVFTAETTTAAL